MRPCPEDFFDFVGRSPSVFHVIRSIEEELESKGFRRLLETEAWTFPANERKFYVTRNGSAIIAFVLPEGRASSFQIVASHSDSPCLKLKPQYEDAAVDHHYVRVNVEPYGGLIMSTWLDRPLSIAGRVLVREKTEAGMKLVPKLVDLARDAVVIPNMPIHFNREINKGYAFNAQQDLLPLYGDGESGGSLQNELAALCEAAPGDMVGADLFLYNRTPGAVFGPRSEFFSCARIDNLECAYTSLLAFEESQPDGFIPVCAVFDNEEVGSNTKQGADSDFLRNVLHRVMTALGASDSEAQAAIAGSFMVSADNAHAVHPNHAEKYDAQNRTFMNAGIVIKHNANQKYTTDGVSCAVFAQLCENAGIPVQHFANRSDVSGGSTLGCIANSQVSMNTVDIGLAQLAMHSSYETAGSFDLAFMVDGLRAFYQHRIQLRGDHITICV